MVLEAPVTEGNLATSLYTGDSISLIVPSVAKIPIEEGIHIDVVGRSDVKKNDPKNILRRFCAALGAAKVVAESGLTAREPWANTRIEADNSVSVYGRTVTAQAWRKPVDTVNRAGTATDRIGDHYNVSKLQRLLRSYMPGWERFARTVQLFDAPTIGHDIPDKEDQWTATIWESEDQEVVVVKDVRHINGIHVMVRPKKEYEIARQWQAQRGTSEEAVANRDIDQPELRRTLEGAAIALGVRTLLGGKGEIHNSGNWAKGLRTTDEPLGKLDVAALRNNPKVEKLSHRPDIAYSDRSFGSKSYFHLYIPEGDGPVVLPAMYHEEVQDKLNAGAQGPEREALQKIADQWKAILPLPEDELLSIRQKLGNGALTGWLEMHCKGSL